MRVSASTLVIQKEENLLEYIKELDGLNVDLVHCDVIDGEFVPEKCLSTGQVSTIKYHTTIPLDVHFMGYPTPDLVEEFLDAGANILTLHVEALSLTECIVYSKIAHDHHVLFGLAINPDTKMDSIREYLEYVDLVLVMGVMPGKCGQTFIADTYQRLEQLKNMIADRNIFIEVDGGVTLDIAKELKKFGVSSVVMGNTLYKSKEKEQLLKDINAL